MGSFGGRCGRGEVRARSLSALACALTVLGVACGGQSSHADSTSAGGSASGGVTTEVAGAESSGGGGGSAGPIPIPPEGGSASGGASSGGDTSVPEAAGAGGAGDVDLGLGAGDLTVLVVFDKSGSMGDHWDERSKWQVANEAFMKAIVDVLDNLTIGTIFFPVPANCDVDVLSAPTQMGFMSGRRFYENWLDTAETRGPNGGTPLELALRTADAAIQEARELGLLNARFRVVVVTDGEPSCNDNRDVITALPAAWHELGVETVVMGLPGSATALKLLDDIAAAGGTEKAQSLADPSQLDHGLYDAVR